MTEIDMKMDDKESKKNSDFLSDFFFYFPHKVFFFIYNFLEAGKKVRKKNCSHLSKGLGVMNTEIKAI